MYGGTRYHIHLSMYLTLDSNLAVLTYIDMRLRHFMIHNITQHEEQPAFYIA